MTVTPGSDQRTVTVSFGYPDGLRSLVAKTLRLALAQAEARWGKWQTIESISTPDTIYADLTGLTRARLQPGTNRGGGGTIAGKLRAIGYKPAPGEIGSVRYFRSELPRRFGDPNAPSAAPNWFSGRNPPRRRAGGG